jgi:hypothetical protein
MISLSYLTRGSMYFAISTLMVDHTVEMPLPASTVRGTRMGAKYVMIMTLL